MVGRSGHAMLTRQGWVDVDVTTHVGGGLQRPVKVPQDGAGFGVAMSWV
jgi:hypothetical protein